MGGDVVGTAAIFSALTAAIAWLAKRLIDRLERDNAALEAECAALRKLIDDRVAESLRLSEERAKEIVALREEVAAVRRRTRRTEAKP